MDYNVAASLLRQRIMLLTIIIQILPDVFKLLLPLPGLIQTQQPYGLCCTLARRRGRYSDSEGYEYGNYSYNPYTYNTYIRFQTQSIIHTCMHACMHA